MRRPSDVFWMGALVAAVSLSACRTRNFQGGAKPSIVGADPALLEEDSRTRSTAAVMLLKNDGIASHCSAVLVAENLALTAAHCLDGVRDVLGLFFGRDAIGDAASVRVTKWKQHPKFNREVFPERADYDIAWLKLDGPLPFNAMPIPVEVDFAALRQGQMTTIAGYGSDSEWDWSRKAERRNVDMPILEILSNQKELGGHKFSHLITLGVTPKRGACHGDSGGPLFVGSGNAYRVAGLTHGVDVFPDVPADGGDDIDMCAVGKVAYVAIGGHRAWIEESSGVRIPTEQENFEAFRAPQACPEGSERAIDSAGYCLDAARGTLMGPFSSSFQARCRKMAPAAADCTVSELSWRVAKPILNQHPFLSDHPPADHLSVEDRAMYEMRQRGFEHPGAKRFTERLRGKVMMEYEDVRDPASVKYCVEFSEKGTCRMRLHPDYGGDVTPEGKCRFSAQDDGWVFLTCRTITGMPCNMRAPGATESLLGHITGKKIVGGIANFTGEEPQLLNEHGQASAVVERCSF